jgi:uncharacterized protein YyaL (SSP411 family)
MSAERKPNALIHATSPYLLQHAYNPVAWQEWNDAALAQAKAEGKPILVSIGYSSCHWCHVMEHQSFENEDIAALMNEYFVCIKVDREERPDIDHVYMDAVQAMGMNGGWPLNVFLTPDQKPFYGGTYFPPANWAQVLTQIHKAYQQRRGDILKSADSLAEHLANNNQGFLRKKTEKQLADQLDAMYNSLAAQFDHDDGGLSKAPKFIMPTVWLWLLRYHYVTRNDTALQHTLFTLKKIAAGGIYDQIGGGFARYSVDRFWFAPHFEKMLYDNAQLLSLYSEAYLITRDESFRQVIEQTITWLERDMRASAGAFYSALDADSEGVEGKYYCWTKPEIQKLLGADAEIFCDYYGVTDAGNWEHGMNILKRDEADDVVASHHGITTQQLVSTIRKGGDLLMQARSKRIAPGLDDKIITGWNAMTVTGLTDAYHALGEPRYLALAQQAMTFLLTELTDGSILYRSFKGKRSSTTGFLEDYAFMIQGLTNLYLADWNEAWLHRAEKLLNATLENFLDTTDDYFHFSSKQSTALIANKKEMLDNVIPASNSVMAMNLFQLGTLLDRDDWKQHAERMASGLGEFIVSEPNYMSNWGMAWMQIQRSFTEVAITGPDSLQEKQKMRSHFLPLALVYGTSTRSDLPLLRDKSMDQETMFYVCENKTCYQPVRTVAEALAQIR